eukprot:m.10605 g.10605  ORF g.10605 m.10605 type:complete len:315 (+) comp8409_c0_seq1:78-1022(+)
MANFLEDAEKKKNKSTVSPGMAEIFKKNNTMHSEESVKHGQDFKPTADDVFIVTYPKCGTTWVTQIIHSLRSRGHMDFDEITEVAPWDILALDCKQELDAKQAWAPRVFKSHEPWGDVAKGGRYVYVVRNPQDAFVSFYNFLPGYMGVSTNDVTMEEFADAIFAGVSQSGKIWHHFLDWWEQRNNPNVLWLFYEDLKEDLSGAIRQIAAFLKIDVDDDLMAITETNSTYKFMSEHNSKFDDHFVFDARKVDMGFSADAKVGVSKVHKGNVGAKKTLPEELRQKLQDKWTEIITSKHPNLVTYDDMRKQGSKANL